MISNPGTTWRIRGQRHRPDARATPGDNAKSSGRPGSDGFIYLARSWRHDVEPEILVQIDEVAHELHELRRVTGKLDQPGLDRVLERQLPGQDLGQGSSFNGYSDIGLGVRVIGQ